MQVFRACVPLFLCYLKKYREKFCDFRNKAYLCTAKIHVRYVDAATIGGICCICHIISTNPIGAAASGSRKAPVASHM